MRSDIASALPRKWKLREFQVVDRDPKPWAQFFAGDAYVGYAARCRNPSETIEESRSKASAAAGSATHNPAFYLWLFHAEGLTLARARQDLDKKSPPYMQVERPELLGESKQFIAACLGDCSRDAVLPVLQKLGIKAHQ